MLSGYKTFIGLIIAAAPNVAQLFGYEFSPSFSDEATALANEIVTILGLVIAAYGRATAQAPGWLAKRD